MTNWGTLFETHGHVLGRGSLTKDAKELHYGKCSIQHFQD